MEDSRDVGLESEIIGCRRSRCSYNDCCSILSCKNTNYSSLIDESVGGKNSPPVLQIRDQRDESYYVFRIFIIVLWVVDVSGFLISLVAFSITSIRSCDFCLGEVTDFACEVSTQKRTSLRTRFCSLINWLHMFYGWPDQSWQGWMRRLFKRCFQILEFNSDFLIFNSNFTKVVNFFSPSSQ